MDRSPPERDPRLNTILMYILGLPGLHMAYYTTVFNPMALPLLEISYGLTDQQEVLKISGNLPFIFALGATLGVLCLGLFANRFGRVQLLFWIEMACCMLSLLYSIKNLFVLQILRFFSGAIGGMNNPLSGIILVELLPKRLSAKGNVVIFISVATSVMASYCTPLLFTREQLAENWQLILSWPAPFHLLRAWFIYSYLWGQNTPKFTAETTRNLIDSRQQVTECAKFIYKEGEDLDRFVSALLAEENKKQGSSGTASDLRDLFLGRLRHKQWSGIFVNVIQAMTGGALLGYYSKQLFDGISGNGGLMTVLFGFFNVFGGFVGVQVIEKFARVDILVYGCYIESVSLACLVFVVSLGAYLLAPLFLVSFVVVNAISLGATMNLYVNEILPPAGVSIAVASSWVSSGLIGKFTPYGLEYIGSSQMLFGYSILALIIGKIISLLCYDPREKEIDYPSQELHELQTKILEE